MTFPRHVARILIVFFMPIAVSVVCSAQTADPTAVELSNRVEKLQKELEELQTQLANLKTAPPPSTIAASQMAAPLTTSNSASSISSLLGPTSLSGFVDMYYSYNANQPVSRTSSFRSFDAFSNQFALNLVELTVDKAPAANNSRTGYHLSLGYGQAINAVNGTEPGGLSFAQYLKEAYFSYLAPAGKGLQVDLGKFVTPAGAEVIETKDNWNYSRGLLFSYAIPYYHFGIRAKYAFNDKYSLTGYVVNGWNNLVENNTGKTYGMSLGWNVTKKVSVTQNYMAGPEQASNSHWRQLWDTVVTYSPTSKLSLMANSDYGRGDRLAGVVHPVYWTGLAGYVKYAFNDKYAVATRYEYYDDHDGFTTGTAQNFNGVTGTFQRAIASHILTRLEFRRDMSNRPTFVKGNNVPALGQNTATAGLVFMFDSREAR
ncbi:MAG: porin [Terriglobales bacterium]